jgi:hypothetical protein
MDCFASLAMTWRDFVDVVGKGTLALCPPWALLTDLLRAQAQLRAAACDKSTRRANQF